MGGKAAMALALTQPEIVNRMIIADIAPVAYTHTQAHLIAAMRGVDLTKVQKRSDADAALAMVEPNADVRAFLLQSLDVKAKTWRLNLDALEAAMPDTVGWREIDAQAQMPTLFLSGADSHYVLPAHRDTIKRLFPNARFAKIPGAGHWLHAEKPREFEAAVTAFLSA
jgi:pimeloyl-ACP methyl ester carboxylesterase